mgnify:CR=1 FL=1
MEVRHGPANARDWIIVDGQRKEIPDTQIVTFAEDHSWDFSRLVHENANREYTYARRNEKHEPAKDLLAAQEVIDMVVVHSDITINSAGCFRVLKARGYSTHFMIDWDGTIYQGTDVIRKAIHAACQDIADVNNRSIGIDMNCLLVNYARSTVPAPGAVGLGNQFSQGGERRMSDLVELNGVGWKSWGYTDAQYDSLVKLLKALATVLPKLKLTAPIDERGEILWRVPAPEDMNPEKIGIYGHMHLTAEKFDPGPGFDWPRLLQGLSKEHNRFPIELLAGRSIPNLLTRDKVTVLADEFYANAERSEQGGYYPIGLNGQWHGGCHIHADQGVEVRAMFDGVVVAARNGDPAEIGSNNFVLLQHVVPFDPNDDKKSFTFYSLYMHLQRFDDERAPLTADERDRLGGKAAKDTAPAWVWAARRVKTGSDADEEDEPRTDEEREEDEERTDGGGPSKDGDDEEEDAVRREKQPYLDVGKHLSAMKRGDVALFAADGTDQTRVAAGDPLGRIGFFGEDSADAIEGLLHVEVFADGRWRQTIDLLGVHGAHWWELEADADDNLSVDTDDLLTMVAPDSAGARRKKLDDFIFSARRVAEDDIMDFFTRDADETSQKPLLRRAITRHVSEWSDQVDWFKSLTTAQGWDEQVKELADMLANDQGRWLRTLFATQITRQLPFMWLNAEVAEHIGLQSGKTWDGLLYYFHPIHFVMWMTFHTNTRLRVLAKGRDKRQLAKLRRKEEAARKDVLARGDFPEDFDHGAGDMVDVDLSVRDPAEVLRELWDVPAQPGEWRRRIDEDR